MLYKSQIVSIFLISSFGMAACTPPTQVAQVTTRAEIPSTEHHNQPIEPTPSFYDEEYAEVEIGPFEDGKMWTLDNIPVDYMRDTHGVEADSAWIAKARLGALRLGSFCSASVVSEKGLVMTNHHCARDSITEVERDGESLLDNGFYAKDDSLERSVAGLYVEQLIQIDDVSEEVLNAAADVIGAGPQAEARRKRAEAIERRNNTRLAASDSTLRAEVVNLYSGGRYALYTYKKYADVRLVFAPELAVGYFGGDTDNFTYPRHTFDASFFRVWSESAPLNTPDYFRWEIDGASEGESVFVVGNPGSTSRLSTVSQLEYRRNTEYPAMLEILSDRIAVMEQYVENEAITADSFDVRNDLMTAMNMQKSYDGEYKGLLYGDVLSRTYSSEIDLRNRLAENDSLDQIYGKVWDDIKLIQKSKRASSAKAGAFYHFLNPAVSSHVLTRALYGYVYTLLRQRGAPPEQLKGIYDEGLAITSWPKALEKEIIERRIRDLSTYLGDSDPTMKRLLKGVTIEQLADSVAMYTALTDTAAFRVMLDDNYLASGDVTVVLISAIAPLYFTLDQELQALGDQEQLFVSRLAGAEFALNGDAAPPDATFTLRIADGIVSSYNQSGTIVPAFTTLEGAFELAETRSEETEWQLPERWKASSVDRSIPFNLVSTNDITGGNSGSPLLNADLEVVGLIFDGNLESLPNEFVYSDKQARAISVDSRAILALLENVYEADRIVAEIIQ